MPSKDGHPIANEPARDHVEALPIPSPHQRRAEPQSTCGPLEIAVTRAAERDDANGTEQLREVAFCRRQGADSVQPWDVPSFCYQTEHGTLSVPATTTPLVYEAFKAVEIFVRKKGKFAETDYGVKLMGKAFDAASGPLRDPGAPHSRREARRKLFEGAFGELRNPKAHHDPSITDTLVAVEEMMIAGALMRIVDSA